MERNFYTDDFEELLKEKADQYKMYPSDKVWNGIQNSLHSKRKWYWIGFALLLSGVSYYAIDALVAPPKPAQRAEIRNANTLAQAESSIASTPKQKDRTALVIPLASYKASSTVTAKDNDQPFYGVFRIDKSYSDLDPEATAKVVEMLNPPGVGHTNQSTPGIPLASSHEFLPAYRLEPLAGYHRQIRVSNQEINTETVNTSNAEAGVNADFHSVRFPIEQAPSEEDIRKINWLQEYALAELSIPKTRRLGWQIAFSPTMNYRKLSTSKNPGSQFMVKNVPMALSISGDLDNLVNHKPAIGFELGTHLRYTVDRTVTVKAGIQFNYARYAIEAFAAGTPDVATIALTATGAARQDSLISYSSISNFGGNSVKDIQNQYFQLSAPIGLELKVLGGKKLQLHVAGTVQPTYLINRNTYLITTDYQSYTHEPSLVRRWNVNTSAEAFLSYSTGGISWQVGPQFRYQILSSYSSKYPISEHLMEYGVKIGVTKNLR